MSAGPVLGYVAAMVLIAWGVAHLVPVGAVTASFGDISLDSRRILVMEWVAEGITHISIGVLVVLMIAIEGAGDSATHLVCHVSQPCSWCSLR
jgi:hypothetical protein